MSTICEITEAVRRRSAHSESSIVSFFRGPSLSVAPRQPPDDENLQRSSGARNEIFGRPTHAPSSLWHSQVSSHGTRTTAAYAAACRPAAKPAGTHGKHTHTHTHTDTRTDSRPRACQPACLPRPHARPAGRRAGLRGHRPQPAGRSAERFYFLSGPCCCILARSSIERTNEAARAASSVGMRWVGISQSVGTYFLPQIAPSVRLLTYLL